MRLNISSIFWCVDYTDIYYAHSLPGVHDIPTMEGQMQLPKTHSIYSHWKKVVTSKKSHQIPCNLITGFLLFLKLITQRRKILLSFFFVGQKNFFSVTSIQSMLDCVARVYRDLTLFLGKLIFVLIDLRHWKLMNRLLCIFMWLRHLKLT